MKNWIDKNLMVNNKFVAKRLKKEWFSNNGFINEYNQIIAKTAFPLSSDKFSERLWHICNDSTSSIKCHNSQCNNIPAFTGFFTGYLKYCCNRCAQTDDVVINKIKVTNLEKYGNEYGLQSTIIKDKIKKTNLQKYGVENVSQIDSVKLKKKKTCMENHGVDYFLEKQKEKECAVYKKYGVKNVQQVSEIKNKTAKTRRLDFYDSLFSTNRLQELATPMFSKNDYVSGGLFEKYKFKCNKCCHEFLDCLEDGDLPRCPKCYKSNSYFQMEIYDYIKTLTDESNLIMNCKTVLTNKDIDIYIPHLKLAIECDGLYWHGEINGNKDKKYHLNKTIECENKNIHLIHIFEDEWMLKKDVVKSKLTNFFKQNDSIYARKCVIKPINNDECQKFLINNHIQGKDNSSIQYGLYYNDKLVMAATFGNLRMIMGNAHQKNVYELYRLCSSINVVGGASKLIKHFIKQHSPIKIISYADRRYTYRHNAFYEKIGFKLINEGVPNYWYYGKYTNYKRFHRFSFSKQKLSTKLENFDESLSEWENMKNNGYDRIWDCGSIKYELNVNL
jgi:hypothetical protein